MAGNITEHAKITGNGGDLTLDLPNLTYAYSLEISNASDIRLPMLSSVSNGLDVNYSEISELSIPELSYVGGDLVLTGNRHLSNLDMPELVNIQGNFEISDSEDMSEIGGLPYLSSIGGDMNLMGGFTRYAASKPPLLEVYSNHLNQHRSTSPWHRQERHRNHLNRTPKLHRRPRLLSPRLLHLPQRRLKHRTR